MRFDVLGPLEIDDGGGDRPVRAAKQRVILATLLLNANSTVTGARLCDAVWGEAPPALPRRALHTHVLRLRDSLGEAAQRIARELRRGTTRTDRGTGPGLSRPRHAPDVAGHHDHRRAHPRTQRTRGGPDPRIPGRRAPAVLPGPRFLRLPRPAAPRRPRPPPARLTTRAARRTRRTLRTGSGGVSRRQELHANPGTHGAIPAPRWSARSGSSPARRVQRARAGGERCLTRR